MNTGKPENKGKFGYGKSGIRNIWEIKENSDTEYLGNKGQKELKKV
ncbi:hypothetical protein ACSAZL_14225 [Methanosarcina sp. T3]